MTVKKFIDALLGKPSAHSIPLRPNRKQRRMQAALRQKEIAAPNRRKYEKRGVK